jgi:nitrile hydratase
MLAPLPKYRPGDEVRVRTGSPPGHFRTPQYIQGKVGRVEALCGVFKNPESLACGGTGLPQQPLYRVEFFQTEVWEQYRGPKIDTILVDLYEHWLDLVDR